MLVENVLSTSAYWCVNKAISREVGVFPAILLSELIERRKLFKSQDTLDKGWFWMDNQWLQDYFDVSYRKLSASLKKLEEINFITSKQKQVNNVWRKFYLINDTKIVTHLLETDTLSKKRGTPGQNGEENKTLSNKALNNKNCNIDIKDIKVHREEEIISNTDSTCGSETTEESTYSNKAENKLNYYNETKDELAKYGL